MEIIYVTADRDKEGLKIYESADLVYFVADNKGKTIGIFIKPSSFFSKPTSKNTNKRFAENQLARKELATLKKMEIKNLEISFPKPSIFFLNRKSKLILLHINFRTSK